MNRDVNISFFLPLLFRIHSGVHKIFTMAKWTRKDLQQRFGMRNSKISQYKSRGNVVIDEDGLIDDSNPINAKFINRHVELQKEKAEKAEQEKKREKPGPKPKPKQPPAEPIEADNQEPEPPETEQVSHSPQPANGAEGLDARYKLAQSRHKEEQTRKEQLLIERMEGKLIPVADIQGAFRQIISAMRGKFDDGIEALITELQDRKKMSNKEVAEIRERMVGVINSAVDDAVNESQKSTERIVDDNIEKKS